MTLFDTNAFFGHWPYWPLPQTSGEDVLQLMDRWGIDRAAITSLRGLHGNWQDANTETLSLAKRYPDRVTPIGCISPMNGGGPDALGKVIEAGIRGVRLYPSLLQGYSLQSPFADDIARTAGKLDVPVVISTRPIMNFRFAALPVEDVAVLAQRHPRTRFVLSGPNYLSEFNAAIEALHKCPNLTIEISCMQGFQAIARLKDAVGAERILFGTGLPLHYPACNLAKLEHANISKDERTLIARQNAVRLLGLDSR
jgi:predicted TIM-barrel fold metal-dependent hydrolase